MTYSKSCIRFCKIGICVTSVPSRSLSHGNDILNSNYTQVILPTRAFITERKKYIILHTHNLHRGKTNSFNGL